MYFFFQNVFSFDMTFMSGLTYHRLTPGKVEENPDKFF